MNIGTNKANLIKQKIEAGFATKKDKEWLDKWNKKQLKIRKK